MSWFRLNLPRVIGCKIFLPLVVLIGFWGLLPALSCYAEKSQSLQDIYLKAVDNDPTFSGAEHTRAALRDNMKLAWSELLPSINAYYRYTDTTQKTSYDAVLDDNETDDKVSEYNVSLRQPVLRIDSILSVRQAKVEQVKADLDLEVARQELILRVTEKYLQALISQDQLEYAQAEQAAVNQHNELAKARFEMGLAPITDLYDARARLAAREAITLEAETQLVDSFQALRELTGEVPDRLVPLGPEFLPMALEPDDPEKWLNGALAQNLSILAQRQLVKIARREVGIQRSGHYPALDLVGSFNVQENDGSSGLTGGTEVETTDIGLQLSVPLFEGGKVYYRTRQAFEQKMKAETDYERVIRQVVRVSRSSFMAVKNAVSRIGALEEALLSQNSALEAKQEGYRAGLFTSLAVLDAERDLYAVKNELSQARYDYIFNYLKLRQAIGSLSRIDLELASNWFSAPQITVQAK